MADGVEVRAGRGGGGGKQIDGMVQKWPEINGRQFSQSVSREGEEDFRKYEKEGTDREEEGIVNHAAGESMRL